MIPFPNKKYSVIYADPPWSYHDKRCNGNALDHYQTMRIDDICSLPVQDIADDNCVLFLIENRPAVDLIRRFNHSNVLIYADPPYLLNTRGGKQYRCEMTSDEDHKELLDALLLHKGPVILSGYHSELYDDTLHGWSVIEKKTYNQNADMRTEVLWCNFDLPQLSMDLI